MQKQLGITLLETLLAIVISSVVVVLGVRYYRSAYLNTEVVQASSQMNKIIQASYTWLQGQRQVDFGSADNAIDIEKLISASLLVETDKTDPWGGSILIEPGSNANYVRISLPGASKKACQNLSLQMENVAQVETLSEDCADGKGYSGEF